MDGWMERYLSDRAARRQFTNAFPDFTAYCTNEHTHDVSKADRDLNFGGKLHQHL